MPEGEWVASTGVEREGGVAVRKHMQDVLEYLTKAEQVAVYHRLSAAEVKKAQAAVEEARAALEAAKAELEESKRSYEAAIDECPVENLSRTKIRKMLDDRVDQMVELGLLVLPEEAVEAQKPSPRKRRTRKKKEEQEAVAEAPVADAADAGVVPTAEAPVADAAPATQEQDAASQVDASAQGAEHLSEATVEDSQETAEVSVAVEITPAQVPSAEEASGKVEPEPEKVAPSHPDPFAAALGKVPVASSSVEEAESVDQDPVDEEEIPDEMLEEVIGGEGDESDAEGLGRASPDAQEGIRIPSFLLGGN